MKDWRPPSQERIIVGEHVAATLEREFGPEVLGYINVAIPFPLVPSPGITQGTLERMRAAAEAVQS